MPLPDWLVDLGGDLWTGVKDYATDPDTIGEWFERYMFENPGLTVDELLDLARETNKLNNPNVQNPFGGTTVTYDDDGQGTVSQYMNQGTLDLVNSIGRRLASGEVNTFQTPQGVLDAGTQAIQNQTRHNELQRNSALVEQLQRENPGMSDVDFQNLLMQQGITTAPQDVNWFVGGNREPTTWTDLVNPSGAPTGGTGSPVTGPTPTDSTNGQERGDTLDRGTGVGNNVGRDNETVFDDFTSNPSTIRDSHREIFEREGLGQEYDTIKDHYERANTGVPWGQFIKGYLVGGSAGGALYAAARWLDDKFLLSERSILEEVPVLAEYEWGGPLQGNTDIPWEDMYSGPHPMFPDSGMQPYPPQEEPPNEETLLDYDFMDPNVEGSFSGGGPTVLPGTGVQMGGRTPASRIRSYYIGGRRVSQDEYEAYMKRIGK